MQAQIKTVGKKFFTGKRGTMSFANNTTHELWRSFMPLQNEITNRVDSNLYSLEVYPDGFFETFNPAKKFEKWAAVAISSLDNIPAEMETLTAPRGMYAVFIHYGPAVNGPETYRRIFTEWLPVSDYVVDQRPHMAVMGPKYKTDSTTSEEEIWIPIKLK